MAKRTGKCLCGAVTYSVDAAETDHHACHCEMCRHWAGGPVFASFVENIQFQGEEHIARFQSSEWAERGFCSTCGSNLFYRLKETDQLMICVGSFDDPTPFTLVGELFIDNKPDGYAFTGDHPRLTEAETLAMFESS